MYPSHRRRLILIAALIGFIIVVALLYWLHTAKKSTVFTTIPVVKGTFSTPTPHAAAPSTNNGASQGGVVDQKGQTTDSLPPSSEWASSASKNITLKQPTSNQVVSSGDTLSGLAKVSFVQFILKDSAVGVIAQGNLNVVNGKFSGTLQFTPHAKSGTLEIYYPNPSTGAEEDIINISVNYSD